MKCTKCDKERVYSAHCLEHHKEMRKQKNNFSSSLKGVGKWNFSQARIADYVGIAIKPLKEYIK